MQEYTDLAEECLNDYDLNGWTDRTWSFDANNPA